MWGTCKMWTAQYERLDLMQWVCFQDVTPSFFFCLQSFFFSHLMKSRPLVSPCLTLLCMHSHSRATCANIHSILYLHNYYIGPGRVPYHIHSNYQQNSQSDRSTVCVYFMYKHVGLKMMCVVIFLYSSLKLRCVFSAIFFFYSAEKCKHCGFVVILKQHILFENTQPSIATLA